MTESQGLYNERMARQADTCVPQDSVSRKAIAG